MKNFRHFDFIRPASPGNRRRLAAALLLSICVGTYAEPARTEDKEATECGRADNPGEVLKETLKVSAGGPYTAKAGSPVTLHGTYTVAGQTENSNRLKAIGKALQSYLEEHGSYPPAALLNAQGKPTVSWRVLILPYLGHRVLYDRFDLTQPWDDFVNLPLLREMPAVYRQAGEEKRTETGFAGVEGVNSLFEKASAELSGGRPVTGISQTEIIAAGPVGEDVHLPWTAPGDIDIAKVKSLGAAHGFAGEGHAFTPLLFLDGTVHLMPNDVGAGAMFTWTHVLSGNSLCRCAPPSSVDAGIRASWDLGENATPNREGWNATFVADQPGTYAVTLRVVDRFGGHYQTTTKVKVRRDEAN